MMPLPITCIFHASYDVWPEISVRKCEHVDESTDRVLAADEPAPVTVRQGSGKYPC
jgi:hypothetical protein